jgi:hypothetical protein
MSGECEICGEHALECTCAVTQEELEKFAIDEVIDYLRRWVENPSEHD